MIVLTIEMVHTRNPVLRTEITRLGILTYKTHDAEWQRRGLFNPPKHKPQHVQFTTVK